MSPPPLPPRPPARSPRTSTKPPQVAAPQRPSAPRTPTGSPQIATTTQRSPQLSPRPPTRSARTSTKPPQVAAPQRPRSRLTLAACALLALTACEQPDLWPVPPPQPPQQLSDLGPLPDAAVDAEPPPFEAPRYTLRYREHNVPIELDMDRDEVRALLGAISDDVVVLQLDPTPLLRNVLAEVKAACGEAWREDAPRPQYDCEGTALGRSFSRPGQPWQQSPEFALVRLLTMTPANVRVEGSSLEIMQAIADTFNIGGGFSQLLADSLGIARTDEIVPSEQAVISLRQNLLATHPNTTVNGHFEITMGDILDDLTPFAHKLGAAPAQNGYPAHPGVLSPHSTPRAQLLTPDFRMKLVAQSNLRVLDGLRASRAAEGEGRESLVLRYGDRGQPAEHAVRFDFHDPDSFSMVGLVADPTVDLEFQILEWPEFVPACLGAEAGCQRNSPQSPVGADSLWALPKHSLEYIVADAARMRYAERRAQICYVNCLAEIAIGQQADPAGWARFKVPLDLGPSDQYLWELLSEVVQVNLHRMDLADAQVSDQPPRPEGEANVSFTLRNVPVGLSGAEAAERVRPWLAQQGAKLSEFLFADDRARSTGPDFVFRREGDGRFVLQFVAPEDLPEGAPYPYQRPGFFSDPQLTLKASRTEVPGFADTTHEKLVVTPREQVVYMEDGEQRRFEVRVYGSYAGDPQVEVIVEAID